MLCIERHDCRHQFGYRSNRHHTVGLLFGQHGMCALIDNINRSCAKQCTRLTCITATRQQPKPRMRRNMRSHCTPRITLLICRSDGMPCAAWRPRHARSLTTLFRRDLADMHGLCRTRRALAFVRDTTPTFIEAGAFCFITCFDFRLRPTRDRRRNLPAHTRRRLPCRLVSCTKRPADIQRQQTEYRDIAKPRKGVKSRKSSGRNSTTVRHAASISVPRESGSSGHRAGNDPPMLRQIVHAINGERSLRLIERQIARCRQSLKNPH